MSAKITRTIEFFGENYEITYTISKYRPATYFQPEEGGDIELISVYDEDDTDVLEDLTELDQEIIIDKIADYERNE